MYRKELNKRSPLRVFERSIHGGLGKGNVGVIVSRAGVGKTAVLVGIALDDLLQDSKVLHVCLDESVDKVRTFYDEVFRDLAETTGLEGRNEAHVAIERNRVIHTYGTGSFSLAKLQGALEMLQEHAHFTPDVIMIDGYPDFPNATEAEMKALKAIAEAASCELWLTAQRTREGAEDDRGLPLTVARFDEVLSVIVKLEPAHDHVQLKLAKDHENPNVADLQLELDPSTLLLKWS